MDYSFIEKNYFITSTTFRFGKEILVCRKKSDLSFAYFYVDGAEYVAVDENLGQELNKIYVIKPSDIRYSMGIDKNGVPYTKERLVQMVKNAKAKVKKILESDLPTPENLIAQERLENVKVSFISKISSNVGSYSIFNNKIKICLDDETEQTLCHELLHAVGKKGKRQIGLEYSFEKNVFDTIAKPLVSFYGYAENLIGVGLEEAVTEFFAEYLTYETGAYADLPNTFQRLCKYLDKGQVLKYKVNNDLKGFIEYVKNVFHETSNEKVLDLFIKMDAYYAIFVKKDEKKYALDFFELNNLSLSMNKIIIDLVINKYIKEGVDISSLGYKDFFDKTNICLFQNEQFDVFEIFESQMDKYIQDKVNHLNEKESYDVDIKKLASMYLFKSSKSVARLVTNNGFLIPEKYKSATHLMTVINCITSATWICFPINPNTAKSLVVRDFLNPIKGFMPKDLHEREKFYESIMQISSILKFNVYKKIPMKNIVDILNKEPILIESAIINNPNYAISHILPKLNKSIIIKNKENLFSALDDTNEKKLNLFKKKIIELITEHERQEMSQD